MKKKYRIVSDNYAGYEVQYKHPLIPFWLQLGCNTHPSVEKAEEWLKRQLSKQKSGKVIKTLENL